MASQWQRSMVKPFLDGLFQMNTAGQQPIFETSNFFAHSLQYPEYRSPAMHVSQPQPNYVSLFQPSGLEL